MDYWILLLKRIAIKPKHATPLPSAYFKTSNEESKTRYQSLKQAEILKTLGDRRRVLHDRVALRLTDSQETGLAVKGFTALLASTEAAGKPVDDELVKLALKTVYPVKKSRSRNRLQRPQLHYSSHGRMGSYNVYHPDEESEKGMVTKRTPVEFLARHYGLSEGDHDEQVEAIAKKLESLRAKEDAAELRDTYHLYRADDQEFVTTAGELIDAAKESPRRVTQETWNRALSTVVQIWKERKMKADISSFIIDHAVNLMETPSAYGNNGLGMVDGMPYVNVGSLLPEFLKQFVEVGELSEVEDFMTQLRLKMIGSEEEQVKVSKLLTNEKSVQANLASVRSVGTYYFVAKQLLTRRTFWIGVKEVQRFQLPGHQPSKEYSRLILEAMSQFDVNEVDSLTAWLGQSSLLKELDEFDPFYAAENDEESSVWATVLMSIRYSLAKDVRTELAKQLSEKTDRTFGEELLLPFAEGNAANIYHILGSKIDTFNALPVKRQKQLAKFAGELDEIRLFSSSKSKTFPVTDQSRAAKRKCLLLLDKGAKSRAVKLMEAKRFRDLNIPAFQFENWAESVVSKIGFEKPDKLLSTASKIAEFSSDPEVAVQVNRNDMLFKSRLIESVIAEDVFADSVKLALAVLNKDDLQDVNFSEGLSKSIGGFFRSEFYRERAAVKKQDKSLAAPALYVKTMENIIQHLGDEYVDQDFRILIPELRDVCISIKNQEAQAVEKWLHSNDKVNYPEIKKAFRLAFDCSRDIQEQWERERESSLPPPRPTESKSYLTEIVDFIADDSIPIQARSRVAVHLVHYDTLSSNDVAQCCQVIATAYHVGQAFEGLQNERIFGALLSSAATPDIKTMRILFAKSWAQSLIQRKRTFRERNLISCMNMIAPSEHIALVEDLIKVLEIDYAPKVTVALVEIGFYKVAEQQCDRIWSGNRFLPATDEELTIYTNKLESKLPAFLKRFDDDGSRYFAEVYFASLLNTETGDSVSTTPADRLSVLADRFPSITFQSKRDRQMSLMLLASSYAKSNVIDQPLADEIKNLSMDSLLSDDDSDFQAKLVGAYLSTQIQLKNFEPVQAKWKEINHVLETNYLDNFPIEAREAVDEIAKLSCDSFYQLLSDQSPTEIAKFLPAMRELNNPAYLVPLNPNTTELAFLMAGRPKELAKYLKEQDAHVKANSVITATRTSRMHEFIENLNVQFERIDPALSARANFVTNAWRFGHAEGFSFGTKSFKNGTLDPNRKGSRNEYGIEQLAQLKILSDEQILELGPQLAEIDSVNGAIWLQLARRQVKAGQDDQAIDSYKKSIDDATEAMDKAKANRKVECAQILFKLKRIDEANKMIEGISAGQLFKGNQEILKKLKPEAYQE